MKITGLLLTALVLAACASPARMNRLKVGMTRDEVVDILGEPDSSKGADMVEVLEYQYRTRPMDLYGDSKSPYWVHLTSGKVDKYGKAGDFGTSEPETRKLILDLHQ